jgi:hypothetical protein
MKLSLSLAGIVAKSVISNVLEGSTNIELDTLSASSASATAKLGTNTFPTIDPGLISGQSGNLYSKQNAGSSIVLPVEQAKQIARSVAVTLGTLPAALEYDTTLSWTNDVRIKSSVPFEQVISIGNFNYFVDIELNDGGVITLSTYSRDIFVPDLYYGHEDYDETIGKTYYSEAYIISIGSETETNEQRIDDGSSTGTLIVPDTVAGIVEAAQSGKMINANIRIRLAVVRDTNILFGPIRLTTVKADKVTHSIDTKDKKSIVSMALVKTWDTILNRYGMMAQYADHLSRFPTDNFMRYTNATAYSFTWKQK